MTLIARMSRRNLLRSGAAAGAAAAFGGGNRALATSPSGSPHTVRIVTTSGGTNLVLNALMQQQEFLRQFGLTSEVTRVSDGSKLMGAILTDEMDLCPMSGFGQVFPAVERGAQIKVVAGGAVLPLQGLMSVKPNIRDVKDLEGKTVGTGSPGALIYQMTVATLRKFGVDISKVRFVNIGSSTAIFRAVAAGRIDAGSCEVWQEGQSNVHSLEHGRFWIDLPEYTYQAGYTSDSSIAKKREVLVRTLAAYAKLYRFIQAPESKEAFVKAYAAGMGKDDRSVALVQWNFYQRYRPFDVDLTISEQRLDYMQKLNLEFGIQKAILPFDKVADMSLAKEAVKLLG